MGLICLVGVLLLALGANGDTPAVCYYNDVLGTWDVYETERIYDASLTCDDFETSDYTIASQFTLDYPNVATDSYGNVGTWTMISSQGFEININERSYFAFSYYDVVDGEYVSYCDQVVPGWARDTTVRNWSCYTAKKTTPVDPRTRTPKLSEAELQRPFKNDHSFINKINKAQNSWTAKAYPQFEKYTVEEMLSLGGGIATEGIKFPEPAPMTEEQHSRAAMYPESFDWGDVNGQSYVSPVTDQRSCGACFAFSSVNGAASRLRVLTQNRRQDIFSVQDIMDCSILSQGCDGGFKYLIAGRYAQDQGLVAESSNPYRAMDTLPCTRDPNATRTYVRDYEYVGGYYGGCNEALIIEELLANGPVPISYLVHADFYAYSSGVYFHTGAKSDFNPHVPTNHAVLLTGYGVDEETGLKYWRCQNSWDAEWGESGYFRILRGVNECSIESAGFSMTVIP